MAATTHIELVVEEIIASLAGHVQIPTFSSRLDGFTVAEAYRVTPLLRSAFEANNETITGRKIGFTNREMWKSFGIASPIWGYTTSRTTRELADTQAMSLSQFSEPRIEPEIMFGLGAAPVATMSDSALLDCIEWVCLGYEIVQSIFPNWAFDAADTIAANGLHGALLLGKRHAIAPRKKEWRNELATFQVELCCNTELRQQGGGSPVLGSPLVALRHLVELLANDVHNPPLQAGEIVSTGTLTLAMPVNPGECWTTTVLGIPLEDVSIQFS